MNGPGIATDLARENEEQRRWRLCPRFAKVTVFDHLLRGEFLSRDEQRHRQSRELSRVIEFAAAEVPYYRDLFAARGLVARDIQSTDDLVKLPLLDKECVRANHEGLRPARLPRGERVYSVFSSSGTTGQPVKIFQTVSSNAMFTYLTQRAYRWFCFDPAKTMAVFRTSGDLPRKPGGASYGDGEVCHLPRWRYAGTFFETGPWLGLTSSTPVARQLSWLQEVQPAYLMAIPSWLEYLTYASEGRNLADSLEGAAGVAEQVTASMRVRLERVLRVPLHQAYGMNEVGLVAARCPAGRYHVHTEHCLVEIVDSEGRPCEPGVPGRIAVTALRNPAMPLVRYDTDDLAEWPADPCPCGRTLPAFVNLIGRYRRYIALPEGAYDLYRVVRARIMEAPDDMVRPLRQFQLHLYRDGRYELRVASHGPMPDAFHEWIEMAWAAAAGPRGETLCIVEVGEIPYGPNGKFQDFTSDFLPAPDSETPDPP